MPLDTAIDSRTEYIGRDRTDVVWEGALQSRAVLTLQWKRSLIPNERRIKLETYSGLLLDEITDETVQLLAIEVAAAVLYTMHQRRAMD